MPMAEVEAGQHRLRVDRFLKRLHPQAGRGLILEWLRSGKVSINGRPVPGEGFFVKRGDRVEWPDSPRAGVAGAAGAVVPGAAEAGPAGAEPEWPPAVIHEDADVLVISKPAGLPTNPSPAAGARNVLTMLERGGGRFHLVHRLDRDTSGLLILARTPQARDGLLRTFRTRRVEKMYDAVVAGRLAAAYGSLRMRLLAHPRRASRRIETVRRGGVEARTDYRVTERYRSCTRLEVKARSGRMHQVRAHLAGAGNFVLGDPIYGRPHPTKPPRLCLHARQLVFPHPRSGQFLIVEAPLPSDLAAFLERLRLEGVPEKGAGRLDRKR
jgi:RluA family pseudouridine synthase